MLDPAHSLPRSSLVGKLARWPLDLIPKGWVVPILSGPLRRGRWTVGAGLHGCWLGTYERAKQSRFMAELQPGCVAYDVGAHMGLYTLLASRQVGPRGKVFAFEPSPANLRLLNRHVEMNRCTNTRIFGCALADAAGYRSFDVSQSYCGRLSDTGGTKVRVGTLDDLLAEGRLEPAHVVKIDVEGSELAVLRGGENFFRSHGPTIFLATHGPQVHFECLELLQTWKYDIAALNPQEPVERTDELLARNPSRAGRGRVAPRPEQAYAPKPSGESPC